MSTKMTERCPRCESHITPTDTPMKVEYQYQDILVKMWRYVCHCGHIWANAFQRMHNEHEVNKALYRTDGLWE